MRRVLPALLLVLAVASAVQATSPYYGSSVTEPDARTAALELAREVGAYTVANPGAPGAFAVFGSPGLRLGRALLVHSHPDLVPSYYFVFLESDAGAAFITLGPDAEGWRAYGRVPAASRGASVERSSAAALAARFRGAAVRPDDLIVLEHGKTLWWHTIEGAPVYVNFMDPDDVRSALPPAGAAPEPQRESGDMPESGPHGARTDLPTSYEIAGVPHYFQVTNYFCGPASLEMVFDYWGPHVGQYDISYAADADPVILGTPRSDLRRAAHFSGMSTAVQDSTLIGYNQRQLGYSAVEHNWSYEPSFSTRFSDLKELVCSDRPVLILTWYSETHQATHYRVVKGYDDAMDVFIVHDPWYTPPYSGPDVHFNQDFLVDDLWASSSRWGLHIAPWSSVIYPSEISAGDTTMLTALVTYDAPHPFEGTWVVEDVAATLSLPPELSLAPGESTVSPVVGMTSSGSIGTASWRVIAGEPVTGLEVSVAATATVSGSSPSYASYSDSIGGASTLTLDVVEGSPTLITVDGSGAGDFRSILEGILCSDDGDTVLVAAGVYTGQFNRNISFDGREIVLLSEEGPDSTIIDCGGAARGLLFDHGESPSAVVDGFTIRNASSPDNYGGGVACTGGSSPTIRDCVISDCGASFFGGGIYCDGGSSPLLEGLVVSGNSSITGSGLYCKTSAAPVVTNCTFFANSSNQIVASDASPMITNSIVAASVAGYALLCQGSADPVVTRSCIFGNAQSDSLCGSYHDNMFLDPLFCDPETGDLSMHDDSPCLPAGNAWGEMIGAQGEGGCGASTGVGDGAAPGFQLSLAGPNPSAGRAAFELTTRVAGRARVVVYNLRGQRVRTLLDANVPQGTTRVAWDGTDDSARRVGAGVYFCTARQGGHESSRKVVLVR